MTDLIMPRRKFLTGLIGLVAAPAVVKAVNIMPVKVMPPEEYLIVEATERYTYWYHSISSGFYHASPEEAPYYQALVESFQRTKEIYMRNMAQNIFEGVK